MSRVKNWLKEEATCTNCGHNAEHHFSKWGLCTYLNIDGVRNCFCIKFRSPMADAVHGLEFEHKKLLACAHYLGVDPKQITKVVTDTDGGGHFTGLTVMIAIPTSRLVSEWVKKNLPTTPSEDERRYILSHARREAIGGKHEDRA